MKTNPMKSRKAPSAPDPLSRRPFASRIAPVALTMLVVLPVGSLSAGALQPGFNQQAVGDVGGILRAWGVGVGSFNSATDSIPDIVAGDTQGDVHLRLGDGNGNFSDQGVVINAAFHDAYSLAVGDFNNDSKDDFALASTGGSATAANEGQIYLYLGNGDGTFQASGFPQLGVAIGVAGTDPLALAAGDVDGDGDVDLLSGEVYTGSGDFAEVVLWRNQWIDDGTLTFTSSVLVSGIDRGSSPLPEEPPYFPPNAYLEGYGLALGDFDDDDDLDLALGDCAHYLYIYDNDGSGGFSPIRYNTPGYETRPFAYTRLDTSAFNAGMPLAVADVNGDGWPDIIAGNGGVDGGVQTGDEVTVWVNEGLDDNLHPTFTGVGVVGGADTTDPEFDTEARGLATGQLNPSVDSVPDVLFGTFNGNLAALFTDIADTDGDGIIDRDDNAPGLANAPRIDMNTDGSVNHLDQLDNDHDGVGDPADDDDDNDGIPDGSDNAPFVANADQADSDGDGVGDVSDPLNDTDTDGDGVTDGPFDAALNTRAMDARARWSRSDTHFIIRIDALGRLFQNEFTQTMSDAAILTNAEWESLKFENYNGRGDEPATTGYQVPADLPGGADCPLTVVVIPRLLWASDPDEDPIDWINNRITNPNLEIALHGTYHANNTRLGDWKDLTDRNFYSSESAGLTLEENFQLLRVGKRTLLGEYGDDQWILDSGVDPATAAKVDWSVAANPLISYAPPFNTADTVAREAIAQLGFRGFSASVAEEEIPPLGPIFTPEGSHMEDFDQFGMFHASADLEVEPEAPDGVASYLDYLQDITQSPGLNTWLIEEVEWCTRYCNDLDRLEECLAAPGDENRENNMVDPARWDNWIALLSHAKTNGEVMTMGDYALAMQFDNAPTVPNPDQADADHDGIGDAIDGAALTAAPIEVVGPVTDAVATLRAVLVNGAAAGIAGQSVIFFIDTDGDGTEEQHAAVTGADGHASVMVTVSGDPGTAFSYRATWDGGLADAEGSDSLTIVAPPLRVVDVDYTPGVSCVLTVEGLQTTSTYRLMRSLNLLGFPETVVSGFVPAAATDTLTDDDPPPGDAFYQVEEE